MYQWVQTFFGLGLSDQDVFLEPAFLLMYHLGFSFTESMVIPISWRRWFIERLNKEHEKQNEAQQQGPSNLDSLFNSRGRRSF